MSLADLARDARFAKQLLLRRPFQVLVQVTNRCNMQCSFCDFWPNGAKPHEELSVADYERFAEQLAEIGTFFISIEGGEPFVRPDLLPIVEVLSRKHITVLYTNGWHVTQDNAKALFRAGVTQVGVSIDYPDAAKHDAKRRLTGATERAWRAVEFLREAAPNGGRQVHVMTVLMRDNQNYLERLLAQSLQHQVSHCLTLISTSGFRRGQGDDAPPDIDITPRLLDLWERYPHLQVFRDYLEGVDAWRTAPQTLPACRAGEQGFNLDHLGYVSPCIEKIDQRVGNVRKEAVKVVLERLREKHAAKACQDCWTLCRGFTQSLGGGGSLKAWRDLSTRMRSR